MKRNSFPEGQRRVGASLTIEFEIELFNPDAYPRFDGLLDVKCGKCGHNIMC